MHPRGSFLFPACLRWVLAAPAIGVIGSFGPAPAWSAADPPPVIAVAYAPPGGRARLMTVAGVNAGLRAVAAAPAKRGALKETHPTFSPDGKQVLAQAVDEQGESRLLLRTLGRPGVQDLGPGAAPQWSRDGRQVLFARRRGTDPPRICAFSPSDATAVVRDLASGHLGRWTSGETELAVLAQLPPTGGRTVAADRIAWELRVHALPSLVVRRRLTLPAEFGEPVAMDWSSDGRRLLLTGNTAQGSRLWLLEPAAPTPQLVASEHSGRVRTGCWSIREDELFLVIDQPDGRTVLVNTSGVSAPTVIQTLPEGARATTIAVFEAVGSPLTRTLAARGPEVQLRTLPCGTLNGRSPLEGRLFPPVRRVVSRGPQFVPIDESPRNLELGSPGDRHFDVLVEVSGAHLRRRQGLGITLFLADEGLVRLAVMDNGALWATLQGRPRQGRVRLLEGKRLPGTEINFERGFRLGLSRRGSAVSLSINNREWLGGNVVTSPVTRVALTMENFQLGTAAIPLDGAYYRDYPARGGARLGQLVKEQTR